MAVIVEAVRTPRGKAKAGGGLSGASPTELLTSVMRAAIERAGVDPALIDDVVVGCATQTGEQGADIARTASLLAGLSHETPGVTINRFCASGLDAVNMAAAKVDAGDERLVLAGGVESVSRVPMFSDDGPLYSDPRISREIGSVHMGVAADLVATLEGFSQEELDSYGVRSHHRAFSAWSRGVFDRSLVLVEGTTLAMDEHVRPNTSVADMASMTPAFANVGARGQDELALSRYPEAGEIRHVHHRGNSPSLADGAGAVLVASDQTAKDLGLPRRGRVRSYANHGVDPVIMLTAGQEAVAKALDRAGMKVADVERFEFAEAFAALCLKFERDLDVEPERFNANGGTIAMGHAFGATGSILVATLLDEMEASDSTNGVVGISGAAGMGVGTVIERV
ncbi:MAG: acetyl-CoA C-acyltransferase [Actinobacteria bacterium]|nr:MAG: acetyl-CoA C-acyltransferase [Actinomycetota bacterium]